MTAVRVDGMLDLGRRGHPPVSGGHGNAGVAPGPPPWVQGPSPPAASAPPLGFGRVGVARSLLGGGGQPVMLGLPFSRCPAKRRRYSRWAPRVTVMSYQPLACSTGSTVIEREPGAMGTLRV
jgi:hypothetical protein